MEDPSVRILMIGPLPPPLGGATVLFKHLVDSLQGRRDVSVTAIGTGGVRGERLKGVLHLLAMIRQIYNNMREVDVVSLHAVTSGLPMIGPIVYLLARLRRKPLIVHIFGGSGFRGFNFMHRMVGWWVVRRATLYLVETKQLVHDARAGGVPRVEWFANSRKMPSGTEASPKRSDQCRRFAFLSQVRPVKGISDLVLAGERFGEDVTVDVYGPFVDGLSEQTFEGLRRVCYRGVVAPSDVTEVLDRYDAVVLPTRYRGEGYPGIIIEAYCVGLPVITTRCGCIPEIVDETCGLLLEPADADALYEAMKRLTEDDELYARLCRGACARRELFDARIWIERFVEYCYQLSDIKRTSDTSRPERGLEH